MSARIGPFTLHRRLGAGAAGEVWAASRGGSEVALKVIRAGVEARQMATFRAEVRALAALSHPAILDILDAGVDGARTWIAMELASGGSLAPRCGALSWPEAKALFTVVLQGLAHAHARGVIHRDLKPENVLLCGPDDERPGWKIADFGLALLAEEATVAQHGGTPAFMAPEQRARDGRAFGPWTDLFAFGQLASTALGGPERADRVGPPGLGPLVARLVHPAVSERYPCAADVLAALDALPDAPPDRSAATPEPAPARATWIDDAWSDPSVSIGTLTDAPAPRVIAGFPSPWRPVAPPRPGSASLEILALREPELVGREAERDAIGAALAAVATKQTARWVLLRGPAGVGKGRLAGWVAARAHETGAARVVRAGHAAEAGPGHGLAAALLRAHQVGTPADAASCQRPWPVAVEALARMAQGSLTVHAEAAACTDVLAAMAHDRPVVIGFDDAQWAAASLEVAALVSERLPLLWLACARDDALAERPHESAALDRLLARPGAVTLRLGPLDDADARSLVDRALLVAPQLREELIRQAHGNPMHLMQLLRDRAERGALEATPRGFRTRAGLAPGLPAGLLDLWTARLDRVLAPGPTEGRRAATAAAVLGQQVSEAEWRAVCAARGITDPDPLLEALRANHLVEPVPDDPARFSFAHGMVREALLRVGDLAPFHGAAAEVVTDPVRRARHLLAAGRPREAIPLLLEAAEAAAARGVYRVSDETLDDLERAAADLPPDDPVHGRVAMRRLTALQHRDRHADVVLTARTVVDEAARSGDRDLEIRARTALGAAQRYLGSLDLAEQQFEAALALAGGDPHHTAHVRSHLGYCHLRRGRLNEALADFSAAVPYFEATGDTHMMANAELARCSIAVSAGRFTDAIGHAQAAAVAGRAAGNDLLLLHAENSQAVAAHLAGDLDAAEAGYQRTLVMARKYGGPSQEPLIATLSANLAVAWIDRGRFQAAREVLDPLTTHRSLPPSGLALVRAFRLPCVAHDRDWATFDQDLALLRTHLDTVGQVERGAARLVARAADLALAAGEPVRAERARAWSDAVFARLRTPDAARA